MNIKYQEHQDAPNFNNFNTPEKYGISSIRDENCSDTSLTSWRQTPDNIVSSLVHLEELNTAPKVVW